MGAAIDSTALPQASREFGVSKVAESAATGLYLVALGLGALVAGPFSEEFGRNAVYMSNLVGFAVFVVASALAPSLGAQLAFRFLTGLFGSTPLTCSGGSLSDLFTPRERVVAFPLFAGSAFIGPALGPPVGGFIVQTAGRSWRWTEWITLFVAVAVLVCVTICLPETYAPVLLRYKAQALRKATGDARFVAAIEIRADTFWRRLGRALYRPFLLVVREPILVLFGFYLTLTYVVFFSFLAGFGVIFGVTYGLKPGLVGLAFLGPGLGIMLAMILIPFMYRWYCRALLVLQKDGVQRAPPELRLAWAMIGAPIMPISLFWMGWTARSDLSVWWPLVASIGFGFSTLCLFISVFQ